MNYLSIKRSDMGTWVESLKAHGQIHGPKARDGAFVFGPVASFEEMSLNYLPTVLPPKKYYFPPKEALLTFQRHPFETHKAVDSFPEIVLFAAHTCDIAGIQCLDIVFSESPEDPNYLSRKERVAIIGIECLKYCDAYASCAAVGTHALKSGYDLMLTDLGDQFAIAVNSDKGKNMTDRRSYVHPLDAAGLKKFTQAQEEKRKVFKNEFKAELPKVDQAFDTGFRSAVWEDVGRRCVACTNCTSVCPTCYCFDVADEMNLDLNTGTRYRLWSNCQMDDFAKVAGGEDFRSGRDARQRHRYYRKFKYSVTKYNKYFCVGCGRCTRTCMAKINLVETVNSLLDETTSESK